MSISRVNVGGRPSTLLTDQTGFRGQHRPKPQLPLLQKSCSRRRTLSQGACASGNVPDQLITPSTLPGTSLASQAA